MNAREVADELGISERTVRRAIADGRLDAQRPGRDYDIDLARAREILGRGRLRRAVVDAELAAMQAVADVLQPLDQETRDRVGRWLVDRFDVAVRA